MDSMTRRSFLKGCAATLGAVALMDAKLTKSVFAAAADGETQSAWKPSFCSNCHFPICAMQIKIKNGVAVEIKGDPKGANKGHLCLRGLSALGNLYNPYRVKTPMKRTNPEKSKDNDPGWVEITWEEALDTVAAKIKEAQNHHPDSVVWFEGFGVDDACRVTPYRTALGTRNNFSSAGGMLCPEHFNQLAFSGQMLDRVDIEHAEYIVKVGRTIGSEWCATSALHSMHFADAVEKGTKLVVVNPVCTAGAQKGEWLPIMPGTDTAFALALLNVMLHEIGKIDEWFLKIRSNAPYLIDDKIVVIKGRKSHKGAYVRSEDGKPLVWDTAKGEAVPFDDSKGENYALYGSYTVNGKSYPTALQVLKDFVKEFTPEWQERFTTIPAAKIRDVAGNLVEHAHIGSTVEIEGYTFPYRPAGCLVGRGMASHMLGISAGKSFGLVNALLGNYDVPGGILGMTNAHHPGSSRLPADADGILRPSGRMAEQIVGGDIIHPSPTIDLGGYFPSRHATLEIAWEVIPNMKKYGFDYEIKVIGISGADLVGSPTHDPKKLDTLSKIPFMFSITNVYDMNTQFCDILMAESSMLERPALYHAFRNEKECTNETRGLMGKLVRRPIFDKPMYNTMSAIDVETEILDRIDKVGTFNTLFNENAFVAHCSPDWAPGFRAPYALDPNKKYTYSEMIELKNSSDCGPEVNKEFDTCSFKLYEISQKEGYNYYHYPENAYRVPIYFEGLTRGGDKMMKQLEDLGITIPLQDMDHVYSHYSGMPVWYEEEAGFDTTEEYPLKAVNWKVHYGVNKGGGMYENAYVQELIDYSNPTIKRIWIASSVAKQYGLAEGDKIRVESRFGKQTEGKIHISEFIHPKCIGIPGKFGMATKFTAPVADDGVHFNPLISIDNMIWNPVSGALETAPQVKITKI